MRVVGGVIVGEIRMAWSELAFGKHKGKTLPQVLFSDPDWFFWACENNVFKGEMKKEADDIYKKARHIRVPQGEGAERKVAEYAIDPHTKNFGGLEIVQEGRPAHKGATATLRRTVIDLRIPREMQNYDKKGCKILVDEMKSLLFGSKKARMTKDRCETIYSDDGNFDLSPA